MSPDVSTIVTITAPTGVDGRGGRAVLNDPNDTDFVGWLKPPSGFGGAAVRTSMDNIPEGHGAVFGGFFYGPRSWTLPIVLARASTIALSNARYEKLCRAMNAMAADGTLSWIEAGPVTKTLAFRREQPVSDPDEQGNVLVAGISADPRIYGAVTSRTGATSHTFTPGGNADSGPTLVIATPSATCNIARTAPSPTETLTFVGLNGGGAVTVNLRTGAITQGGVSKQSAVNFPASTWWNLQPGVSNTVTITDSATLDWYPAWL